MLHHISSFPLIPLLLQAPYPSFSYQNFFPLVKQMLQDLLSFRAGRTCDYLRAENEQIFMFKLRMFSITHIKSNMIRMTVNAKQYSSKQIINQIM